MCSRLFERAFGSWAEMAAAYHFLPNEHATHEEVTATHDQATLARVREHSVVLCLQDITVLNYNGRRMTGPGALNYEAQCRLYLHPAYAVTPQREPQGMLNAWTWARQFKTGNTPRGGVVESVRWTESYERIAEQASELPSTRQICIGDRELDILGLLVMVCKMNRAADYLVHRQHNRALYSNGASCVMVSWPARRWGIFA